MTMHLVETSEEDSFTAVTSFVANLLNGDAETKSELIETPGSRFLAECDALVQENRVDEFLGRLSQHIDTIYSSCSNKDAECCVGVMVHLIPRVEADKQTAAARKLALAIAAKPEEHGAAKLEALVSLYGMCPEPQAKHAVLLATVEFAKTSKALASTLGPVLKGKGEDWQRQWKLPADMACDLYLSLASLFKVVGDKASIKESLRLLTCALALSKADDAQNMEAIKLAAMKPHAVQVVSEFIRSADTYVCDFWELPAVQQLGRNADTAPLLKLLEVMLVGDLAGFKAAATPAVLEGVGVSAEAALEKMRMAALLVLGGRCADNHTPASFSDIQAALDIPAEQVQPWVVRAIGRKLMDGKIDQVAGVVQVSRCHHRTFFGTEWPRLAKQLAVWQSSLDAVAVQLATQQPLPAATSGAQQAIRA